MNGAQEMSVVRFGERNAYYTDVAPAKKRMVFVFLTLNWDDFHAGYTFN